MDVRITITGEGGPQNYKEIWVNKRNATRPPNLYARGKKKIQLLSTNEESLPSGGRIIQKSLREGENR